MRVLYVSVLFALALSGAAFAQTSAAQTPEALTNVYQCAGIENNEARLACYDNAVGRLRTAETEGRIVAVDRQQVETLQRESFGFRLPTLASMLPGFRDDEDADEEFTELQMQVTRIAQRAYGRSAFIMANGQIWVQTESQSARNVRVGDTVTIRRAAMGSFMLSPARSGAALRVRREE